MIRNLVRPLLSNTVLRVGSVRPILFGPCKGLKYRIFPGFGISPLYGGWEPDAQVLMVKHIRPGSVVYDVGANYGIHTLLMARLATDTGHVYAFEPVPAIHSELQKNVTLNGFRNVTLVKLAINDYTGETTFVMGHHDGAGHLATAGTQQGDKLTVHTVTLDEFVFDRGNRPPNFIKVDVEGAESKVLGGGERTLQSAQPIILVDLHTPDQDVAVGSILARCGYEAYRTEDGAKVKDLSKGWPDPDGIWGQIVALPRQ